MFLRVVFTYGCPVESPINHVKIDNGKIRMLGLHSQDISLVKKFQIRKKITDKLKDVKLSNVLELLEGTEFVEYRRELI